MKTPQEILALEQELHDYRGPDRIVQSHELYDELAQIQPAVFQIPTDIPSLDRILDKTELGELVVVTGPTGEGKTTITMTITQNLAMSGIGTVWFTLEVTPWQFLKKITGKGKDKTKLPIFYLPREKDDPAIEWIERRIIEAKVKFDVKVVFIDHIHSIFSLDRIQYRNSSISLEIGDMIAKVKQIALRENLVIYLIAHTKDNPDGSVSREPTKESIRDSGLISRIADTIIGVWRVPNSDDAKKELKTNTRRPIGEKDTWAKVRIMKNRREGTLGTFLMDHQDHRFTEIDTKDYDELEDYTLV